MMDVGGSFASCESCGMKYDKRAMKQIIEGIQGFDDLAKNAKVFLDLKEYGKARQIFTELTDKYPDNARGWWGLVECETAAFSIFGKLDSIGVYYERALKFASAEDAVNMAAVYEQYKEGQAALDLRRRQEAEAEARRREEEVLRREAAARQKQAAHEQAVRLQQEQAEKARLQQLAMEKQKEDTRTIIAFVDAGIITVAYGMLFSANVSAYCLADDVGWAMLKGLLFPSLYVLIISLVNNVVCKSKSAKLIAVIVFLIVILSVLYWGNTSGDWMILAPGIVPMVIAIIAMVNTKAR